MDKHSIVASVFAKLNTVFAEAGLLITDEEKAENIAKLLGLVKGVRKVGGLQATDEGMVFAGYDPAELEKAKELAKMEAEIARLQAANEALKAKRDALKSAA
jgi:hypothetical protein